jgi:uncharacterized PurR-regulated membrane protein YhhQ (DUF165 family)
LAQRGLLPETVESDPASIEELRAAGWGRFLLAVLKVLGAGFARISPKGLAAVLIGVLVLGFGDIVIDRGHFNEYANVVHLTAAALMFGGIIAVSLLHACYAAAHRRRHLTVAYLVIAFFMVWMVIAALIMHGLGDPWWTILAELGIIGGFAAFWIVQTTDVWDLSRCPYSRKSVRTLTRSG